MTFKKANFSSLQTPASVGAHPILSKKTFRYDHEYGSLHLYGTFLKTPFLQCQTPYCKVLLSLAEASCLSFLLRTHYSTGESHETNYRHKQTALFAWVDADATRGGSHAVADGRRKKTLYQQIPIQARACTPTAGRLHGHPVPPCACLFSVFYKHTCDGNWLV